MTESQVIVDVSPAWAKPIEDRRKRADYYFDTVLKGQREWFSKKSGENKRSHVTFAISVIVLGALISVLPLWHDNEVIAKLTAICGSLVAIIRAVDTLLHPGEIWISYRKASEGMKREYRLYINGADAYADSADEDSAYRLLVTRVETIIAEEQQLFWKTATVTPKREEAS